MIVVPLGVGGDVIGTLNIGRMGARESHFDENEFELTKLFAGQASIALQNAEIHRAVEVRAELDALTGLRNHGAFQRELGEAIATDGGAGLALLMMDLDAFKAFNDTLRPPGRRRAAAARSRRRSSARSATGDRAYRYGGDEFAVILPGLGQSEAEPIAERIRAAVAGRVGGRGRWRRCRAGGHDQRRDRGVPGRRAVEGRPRQGRRRPPVPRQAVAPRDGPRGAALADAYLAALNETAVALMDRPGPDRAARDDRPARRPTSSGHRMATSTSSTRCTDELVMRLGTGLHERLLGYRLTRGAASRGPSGRPASPSSSPTTTRCRRATRACPSALVGSVVGIPLDLRRRWCSASSVWPRATSS